MSLDAAVYCTCFKEGKTSPPPFDPALLEVLASGAPHLKVPFEGNEQLYSLLWDWTRDACEHENMTYARVSVGSWWEVGAFRDALERAGWEHFPTLQEDLPEGNGGWTLPEAAARALAELELFQNMGTPGTAIALIDADSGDRVARVDEGTSPFFSWDSPPGVDMGLDRGGFFVVPSGGDAVRAAADAAMRYRPGSAGAEPRRAELFRSTRFEQRLLEPEKTGLDGRGRVEFVDLATNKSFIAHQALDRAAWPAQGGEGGGQVFGGRTYPRVLYVEEQAVTAAEFAGVVGALAEIFRAAVETDNAVVWC